MVAELLQLGGAASADDLFCTSLEAMGVPLGEDFVDWIRDEMEESPLVIQLITPSYMESVFCLCELGAQWVLAKDAFPFTVPPITHADLKAVQRKIQIGRIDDGADLDELFERVCVVVGREPKIGYWNPQREKFLARLSTILETLPGPTVVDAAKYEGMASAYQEETERVERLRAENEELKQKLVDMSHAANAAERSAILVSGDEQAQLDALVDAARAEVKPLPKIVREAFEARAAGVEFRPYPDWTEAEIDDAIADGQLMQVHGMGGVKLDLDGSDPKVDRAMSAIDALDAFAPSQELKDSFEELHDVKLDFSNRRVLRALRIT